MKVCLFQGPNRSAAVALQLQMVDEVCQRAASQGAELVAFPEMFLTGYNLGPERIAQSAEPVDGASSSVVRQIAIEHGVAIVYGYPERDGDSIYNAAQLIDKNGQRLLNYRKTHLFGVIDRSAFQPGVELSAVVELSGFKVALLICYDVEFPETVRALALAGAELIVVPTALMQPYEFIASKLIPARAYENQVFLAYVDRCDQEGG